MSRDIIQIDVVKRELINAPDIDHVLEIRDRAMAAAVYARAKDLEAASAIAKEAQLRAERRAGEFLAEEVKPGPLPDNSSHDGRNSVSLPDLGISYNQSSRWQSIASVPEPEFEAYIARRNGKELTQAGLLQLAARQRAPEPTETPELPTGKYRVIYADPPWKYSNSGFDQSAAAHYPTMTLDDICTLDVPSLAYGETVLFLWATSPLLDLAFRVVAAWGFTYKASMVWDKGAAPSIGWFVGTEHELLLIATGRDNTHPKIIPRSVLHIARAAHSSKPDEMYAIIEAMYDGPYVELFARKRREGWEVWGNEC